MITQEQLNRSISYPQYTALLQTLLEQGKTTGHDQSEEKIGFAKINIQRMARLDKTVQLTEETKTALHKVKGEFIWLLLTEGWCGDTSQNIPVMHAMEKECPQLSLRLIMRDDNPDIMDQYLTNGARSIPKLVCLKKTTLEEMFTWGPRPAPVQAMVMDLLKNGVSKEEKGLKVQQWYNTDKTLSLQKELTTLVTQYMLG